MLRGLSRSQFVNPPSGESLTDSGLRFGLTYGYCRPRKDVKSGEFLVQLTITAAVQARWGHRVDGLIHTHAWTVEATVEGPTECDRVFPADDLEAVLHDAVEPWRGHYLTTDDVGEWKGLTPLIWDREPTVEEITRHLWTRLSASVPRLTDIALAEGTEFDRCRTVRLRA